MLPSGLAQHHSANPAASFRVNSIIALPVLLSGAASLTLSVPEIKILNNHHKNILRNLLKLHEKTPEEVILFLSGSLPAEGLLNLRQLSLFGMISLLPDSLLHKMALHALHSESDSSKSWFVHIRKLCLKYDLPLPLVSLNSPLSKESFKQLSKKKVLDFWEQKLRDDVKHKSSLKYFKPEFMTLKKPHPILTSAKSNPWEVNKAIVQCRILSGRYPTDWLARHWSADNTAGCCVLCPGMSTPGTLEHLLISCPALESKRSDLFHYWDQETCAATRNLLIAKTTSSETEFVQFLIDPSADPDVILSVQRKTIDPDKIFKLTRTFVYSLHRRKLKLTGKFNKW